MWSGAEADGKSRVGGGERMLVECVPNFSEGRRPAVLQALLDAARKPRVQVLGLSADPDHNRAVMTLAGEGPDLVEALLDAARTALQLIDLRDHRGSHPRMGAVDVVPFVPIDETPMAYCVEMAHNLGEQFGSELGLPVYLYERAARSRARVNLARVRQAEFEELAVWMAEPTHRPDYGPAVPHPTGGAVAVGARPPLIAFNAWLSTRDPHVAERVARAVRGSSGGLVGVKALAMKTPSREEYPVQVSMNLVEYRRTSMPMALEMVRREAARYGAQIVRTEVVGFLPLEAVLESARYYLQLTDFSAEQVLERSFWVHRLGEEP